MNRKISCFLFILLFFFFTLPVNAAKMDVGYLNRQKVLSNYPGIQDTVKTIEEQRQAAQQEYDEKSKNMSDEDKFRLNDEIAIRVAQQEAQIMNPIAEKINMAIIKVAKDNKMKQVFDAEIVIHGGKDLTELVIKELNEK